MNSASRDLPKELMTERKRRHKAYCLRRIPFLFLFLLPPPLVQSTSFHLPSNHLAVAYSLHCGSLVVSKPPRQNSRVDDARLRIRHRYAATRDVTLCACHATVTARAGAAMNGSLLMRCAAAGELCHDVAQWAMSTIESHLY